MLRIWLTVCLATVAAVPQSVPAGFPRLGQPAPPFAFSEVVSPTGPGAPTPADLTPAALRGKVIVLDFFATWCGPCIEAIPHTNALIAAMRDQPVVFLAVAKEERALLAAVLARTPLHAVVVRDADGATYRNYYVAALPFVAIIDKTGNVAAFTHPAQVSRDQIEKILNARR